MMDAPDLQAFEKDATRILIQQAPSAEEVDAALGWAPPAEDYEGEVSEVGLAFNQILTYLGEPFTHHKIENHEAFCQMVTVRLAAVLHSINPQAIESKTMPEVAAMIGCSKQAVGRVVSQFRGELSHLRNQYFRSDEGREAMRKAAEQSWQNPHRKKRERKTATRESGGGMNEKREKGDTPENSFAVNSPEVGI